MSSFLCLYSGESVGSARLVAVTSNPEILRDFTDRVLEKEEIAEEDPVSEAMARGRREALEVVRDEAEGRGAGE